MDLGLAGRRALVGGGSSGLGAAIGTSLAAEGARVALTARSGDRLEARAAEIGALAIPADLSTPDGPPAAVAATRDAFGGLDLLVVNSGGPPGGTIRRAQRGRLGGRDRWRPAVHAPAHSRRPARSPGVGASGDPRRPVQLGPRADPRAHDSNLLRPGLAGLIKSLSAEIAPVRINGLAPGRIATPRIAHLDGLRSERTGKPVAEIEAETIAGIPLGRYGDPSDVGRIGAFLLSPAAAYITGAIVPVDGGMIRALP